MPSLAVPPPVVRRTAGLGVALAGTALIASTYGMARFGVGLFAPRLAVERPELAQVVGLAAAAQFVAYSLAAAAAVRVTDRRPRVGLVLAGVTATAGCVGVAVASSPVTFVAAVFVGGTGAGLASPALVRVVDAVVPGHAAATAQSLVNTGTAVGVIGAGLLAFATSSTAPAWVLMAAVCAASAAAVLLLVRGRTDLSGPTATVPPASPSSELWRLLVLPTVAALVVGAGSALIWTFGPLLATGSGPVEDGRVGWLWIALGLGGLVGPATGVVVERLGPRRGWTAFAGVLVLANLTLAAALGLGSAVGAFAAMALFGAGYMCLSGVLILWARSVWPTAAGAGTSVLFIALAVGQAAGSLGFGAARDGAGAAAVSLAAAVLCAVGGALTSARLRPRRWMDRTGRLVG
ncbi:MFS transporter [Solicola sp. PLA-1-18]|uniref:MFS transporter n=1 Tax=Solicola sp. PLA-1-18 TaxID=3380532 RepID=UPI003B80A411